MRHVTGLAPELRYLFEVPRHNFDSTSPAGQARRPPQRSHRPAPARAPFSLSDSGTLSGAVL